jgi:hypothetical protein
MNNLQTIEKGLRNAREFIDTRVKNALTTTANELTDGTEAPIWTGNLQDSVGCGVYVDGVLWTTAIPLQEAEDPRSGDKYVSASSRYTRGSEAPIYGVDGIDENFAYWGNDELIDMLANPHEGVKSHQGWALRYIAAQPYSQIQENEKNFMEDETINPRFLLNIRK